MPPKKKLNGFMIFTLDWKAKYGKNLSLSEATTRAGNIWKDMSAQERGPYNERAKKDKVSSNNRSEKLTCTGMPVALVEKEKLDEENRERQMKRNIETTVRNSVKNCELETQSYFFIMVNYFTKTLKGGVYVPAEISVCELSLKEGVSRKYHSFVNPGVNIYGHQYEAQHHSETTHMLPLPPKAMGETNLGRIYNDILNFIRDPTTGDYPPLYTFRDSMPIVESVLEFLKLDMGANNIELNIYSIQYLFFILKEATCEAGEVEKPNSYFITDAFFERDFYEYQSGIACQYHEDNDKSKYCTQSCVTRWGFMFADYMCGDIAISLIPGRHCPETTNLSAIIKPPPRSNYDEDSGSYISTRTNRTARSAFDYEDNASCISEKSYVTKALSEHQIYHDDQRSMISHASANVPTKRFNGDDFPSLGAVRKRPSASSGSMSASRPTFSSVTGGTAATSTGVRRDRHAGIKNEKDVKPCVDSDDGGACDLNPWAARSRHTPRTPDTSDFTVNYTRDGDLNDDDFNSVASFGRGRGLVNRSFNSTATSGRGRGTLFRP